MNQGIVRPSYNEIKNYIRLFLQNIKEGNGNGPLESFNSVTREVFIKAYDNTLNEVRKVYEIPNPKEEPIRFRSVWVDVFMACLNYYEKKLIKDGLVIEYENTMVRVNGKLYECNSALDQIALFRQISDKLDKLKEKKGVEPIISKKSVVIGNPAINNSFSTNSVMLESSVENPRQNKQKLADTFPKGVYPVTSVKLENDVNYEYDMTLTHDKMERESFPSVRQNSKKLSHRVTDYELYNELKRVRGEIPLIDYDILTKDELAHLANSPLVFVSGTLNHRIDTGFYENCELLNNVPKAAFIAGKAVSPEKILKEASKLSKLSKCINTNIICYEANSEELRLAKDDKLFKAFDALVGLSEILKEEGYTPLICLDNDIRKKIKRMEPNYNVNVPIISRVSSKELDGLNADEDLLVMNIKNDYDELMFTDDTKKYLNDSKKIKTPSR